MIGLLLAWRRPALAALAVLTALLGWSARTVRIEPGVESMIPSGPGDLERLRAFQARFGSDEVVVLALHADRLFSHELLEALDRLTRQAAALPHVARVLSPTNARDLDGDELGPVPVVPYAEVRAGKLSPEAMGERLRSHPILGGLLVARDARTVAVLVELAPGLAGLDARPGLVADLRRMAAGAHPDLTAFVAGIPVEKVDVAAYIARDQRIFVPLVFLILGTMTALLYRHPVGMLVPLLVLGTALTWTLGLFGLAGRPLNAVTSLMSPVILVMSLEATVQLLNQYLVARAGGHPRPAALDRAHRAMWGPCLSAALTAAIGFLSLLTLPIPAIRDFGLFTAVGIMIGYGLTVTLTPLLLASLPDLPPRVINAFHTGPVERQLARIVRRVGHHPRPVLLGTVAVLALAGAGLAQVRVETDLVRSLRHVSPLAAASRFIDARLTGVNAIEIVVPGVSARDPESLARVARLEEAVRALPGVRSVTGLVDLLARVNRAVHRGDDAQARLPDGPDAAEDLAEFLAALGREAPADLARFLADDPDGRSTLRITARVPALDTGSSQALFARIRDAARDAGLSGVSLTGSFVVFSNMSTTLVRHQLRGLAVAVVLVVAVMALQFRSLRLAAVCAIPNVAPVLVVYGLMGWTGVPLSVPTAMIASVAIGTIVDNSIYLLARFREAFARHPDYVEALAGMVHASGRAVVFSTVALAGGFWVSLFSAFVPTAQFGVLTGAAFLLGLVSQLVVLPLVLVLFRPVGPGRSIGSAAAALALAGVAAGLLAGGPASAQEAPREILLKDQFGKPDGPGRHRGQALLLVYGKTEGLRRMKAWEDRLREKAPGALVVLRGLDARAARGQHTEEEASERLRERVPPSIAILLDWSGDLARAYRLPDADVSATVLDARGRACHTAAGPVTPEALDQLLRVLAHARGTGACP